MCLYNKLMGRLVMGEILRFADNLYWFCRDKSFSGHSFTYQESISVSTAEIKGATAYDVTGTPVDFVSLALSGGFRPPAAAVHASFMMTRLTDPVVLPPNTGHVFCRETPLRIIN